MRAGRLGGGKIDRACLTGSIYSVKYEAAEGKEKGEDYWELKKH